jgi:hypothetical protein
MEQTVAEIVTFRLRPGVAESEFLASVPATEAFLRTCPGFMRRRLARDADGAWVDFAEWRDLAAAKAASEGFMTHPDVRAFCGMIDLATTECRHLAIRAAVD